MSQAQIPGPLRPDAPRPADAARPKERPRTGAADATATPAFHVLLERLQRHAAELEQTSRTVDDPARLAGAADAARASLEEAQTLSDRLLEAFRGARQRDAQTGEAREERR